MREKNIRKSSTSPEIKRRAIEREGDGEVGNQSSRKKKDGGVPHIFVHRYKKGESMASHGKESVCQK